MIIEGMDRPKEIEIGTSLDFRATNEFHDAETVEENSDEEWSLQRYLQSELPSHRCTGYIGKLDYGYKKRAVDYWSSRKKGNRKLSSVQTKFKMVTSERQLRRWAHNLNQDGGYNEKLTKVTQLHSENFMHALKKKNQ